MQAWNLPISAVLLCLLLCAQYASADETQQGIDGPQTPTKPPAPFAVLGAASGQVLSKDGLCAFINSFDRHVSGKLVIFVPMHEDSILGEIQLNETSPVEIVAVDYSNYRHISSKKLRYWVFMEWILEHPEIQGVAFSDVRDVVFQKDLWSHRHVQAAVENDEALFSIDGNYTGEHGQYLPLMADDAFTKQIWPRCFDASSYNFASGGYASCSGFSVGSRNAMLGYTSAMVNVMNSSSPECLGYTHGDQAIHNYVINYLGRRGGLDFEFTMVAPGKSPVYNAEWGSPVTVAGSSNVTVVRNDKVIFPAVLHKVDRDAAVYDAILQEYKCSKLQYVYDTHGIVKRKMLRA